MKTLTLAACLAVLVTGCTKKYPSVPDPSKPHTTLNNVESSWVHPGHYPYLRLDSATIRGHEYIVSNVGGIVHSQSCPAGAHRINNYQLFTQ